MMNFGETQVFLTVDSAPNEEVSRNVKVILTTVEGTVPYDRKFGIDGEILDLPINEAKGLYTVECVRKVREYEPRANVLSVDFIYDEVNGTLHPKVVIQIEVE